MISHPLQKVATAQRRGVGIYLERQTSLDLLLKHLCYSAIKVGKNLHRKLGVNAMLSDQIVESVG